VKEIKNFREVMEDEDVKLGMFILRKPDQLCIVYSKGINFNLFFLTTGENNWYGMGKPYKGGYHFSIESKELLKVWEPMNQYETMYMELFYDINMGDIYARN
jgi:hypothetical protein